MSAFIPVGLFWYKCWNKEQDYQMWQALDDGGDGSVEVRRQEIVEEVRPQDDVHGWNVDRQKSKNVVAHFALWRKIIGRVYNIPVY